MRHASLVWMSQARNEEAEAKANTSKPLTLAQRVSERRMDASSSMMISLRMVDKGREPAGRMPASGLPESRAGAHPPQ